MQGAAMTTPILQKTEALRSQSPVLADPKDCSAAYDPTASPLTQTQPQFHGPSPNSTGHESCPPCSPDWVLPLNMLCPQVEL